MKIILLQALTVAGWLISTGLHAGSDAESLASIEQSAIEHIRSELPPDARVTLEPLDQRLRLPACEERLSTVWSPGSRKSGRVTVQVSCESTNRWRIHVQATVMHELEIWVVSRHIGRGEFLSRNMLKQKRVLMGDPSSTRRLAADPVTDYVAVEGFEFTRTARAGEPLDASMLRPRKLILKGERVVLNNSRPGLTLTARGTSMGDASMGERIQIRNDASAKIIDAVVTGRGVAEALNAR